MLGLIVARRAMYWLQSDLTAQAKPASRAAVSAIAGQVLHGFFDITAWFLIGGLAVLAVVLLAGPYRWAAAARSGLAGHVSGSPAVGWARRHLDILRVGGVLVAALAVLVFSVSWAAPSSSLPWSPCMRSGYTGCARRRPPGPWRGPGGSRRKMR